MQQPIHIDTYVEERDLSSLVELWQQAVGTVWPVQPWRIRQVLAGPAAQHFVVYEDGFLVGFAATFQSLRDTEVIGHLGALLVAPERQRQGIGSALHATALDYLRAVGRKTVQLGSISPRFWCGVPTNLPFAVNFFRRQGWQYSGPVFDIMQDISTFTLPERVVERMQREGITFAGSTAENIADVLAFENREFPHWLPSYQHCAQLGDYPDLLVASDRQGQVVGALIMYSAQSHPARTDLIWQSLLGDDAGAISAVGIAERERGRGIGLALVAYGTEMLKQRGVHNCYIDWVELTDFYGKLDYEKWREYYLSWRDLA